MRKILIKSCGNGRLLVGHYALALETFLPHYKRGEVPLVRLHHGGRVVQAATCEPDFGYPLALDRTGPH